MIPAGVAKGISGNAKVAVTASVKLSNSVLKKRNQLDFQVQ